MAIRELGLMICATASVFASPQTEPPIQLQLQIHGDFVEIKIIGASKQSSKLTYMLEVEGGSFTRTKGIANLTAGNAQILSTVRMRQRQNWRATLTVGGDMTYTISKNSNEI